MSSRKERIHDVDDINWRTFVQPSPVHGMGLFARRSLVRHEIVAVVGGWTLTEAEAEAFDRMGGWTHMITNRANGGVMLGWTSPGMIDRTDPVSRGGQAQFANASDAPLPPAGLLMDPVHAASYAYAMSEDQISRFYQGESIVFPESIRPNANAQFDHAGDLTFLRATKNISKGEEIFCKYGSGYWRKANNHALIHPSVRREMDLWKMRNTMVLVPLEWLSRGQMRVEPPQVRARMWAPSEERVSVAPEVLHEMLMAPDAQSIGVERLLFGTRKAGVYTSDGVQQGNVLGPVLRDQVLLGYVHFKQGLFFVIDESGSEFLVTHVEPGI